MKKIASVLIILLMACSFVFAAEATVKLNGTVPEGYVGPEAEDPIAQNGGLKLIMKVVTSTSAESSDPKSYQYGTDAGTIIENVDIVHEGLADGVNSLYIAFGAYGNVPKGDNTASLDVTVTSDGWKDSSDTAEGTLTLTPTTNEKINSDKLFTGAVGMGGVSFSVNTSTSYSGDSRIVEQKDAILVGVSQVTWGLAGTEIPPTGSYTGTITITITGDDGATTV